MMGRRTQYTVAEAALRLGADMCKHPMGFIVASHPLYVNTPWA